MAMNIKNEEAHRLAQELARMTGTSITEAVIRALKDQLKKLENPNDKAQEIICLLKAEDDHLTPAQRTANYDDFLYDENGLPK